MSHLTEKLDADKVVRKYDRAFGVLAPLLGMIGRDMLPPRSLKARGVPGLHSRKDARRAVNQLSDEEKEALRRSPDGRMEGEDADAYLLRKKLKRALPKED